MSASNTLSIQVCPRCDGPIEVYGPAKFAARSRVTVERDIEICAPCGSDEALREFKTGNLIPASRWPVADAHAHHRQLQDAINDGEVG